MSRAIETAEQLGDTTPGAFDPLPALEEHPAIAAAREATRLPWWFWPALVIVLAGVCVAGIVWPMGWAGGLAHAMGTATLLPHTRRVRAGQPPAPQASGYHTDIEAFEDGHACGVADGDASGYQRGYVEGWRWGVVCGIAPGLMAGVIVGSVCLYAGTQGWLW